MLIKPEQISIFLGIRNSKSIIKNEKSSKLFSNLSKNFQNNVSFQGRNMSREKSWSNLKSSRMKAGQVNSKCSSRNISSSRKSSLAGKEKLRDKKADQAEFQKFNQDLAEVLNEMQRGLEIDEDSMKFIIELIKHVKSPNINSLTLKSTDIDIKEFWVILIKLGFINLNSDNDSNTQACSKMNLQEKTNWDSIYYSYQSKTTSQSNAKDTGDCNNFQTEVKLSSLIWDSLKGNENGFISLRNLKVYLVAIMNLWFIWMKENPNSNVKSKPRKNYQILNKNNKNILRSLNKENSLDSQNFSQRSSNSSFM